MYYLYRHLFHFLKALISIFHDLDEWEILRVRLAQYKVKWNHLFNLESHDSILDFSFYPFHCLEDLASFIDIQLYLTRDLEILSTRSFEEK